jgi:hypothetical protein
MLAREEPDALARAVQHRRARTGSSFLVFVDQAESCSLSPIRRKPPSFRSSWLGSTCMAGRRC